MYAIVMAGGLGTRLRPYTDEVPKPLLPVGGTPILEIILTQLRLAGFTRATLALHYRAEQIHDHFGDGSRVGIDIDYSVSDELLGTAGPLGLIERPSEPALVCNADLLTNVDFAHVMEHHASEQTIATMVLCHLGMQVPYGVVELGASQALRRFEEKPTIDVLINTGIYALSPAAWDKIPTGGQHADTTALIEQGLAKGHRIGTYVHIGDWLDIGTPEQYERAHTLFRKHRRLYLPDAAFAPEGVAA